MCVGGICVEGGVGILVALAECSVFLIFAF